MIPHRGAWERETAIVSAESTEQRAEAERAGADAFLLRRAQHASLPIVPDRFGLVFPLAASCVAIVFASIAFAIAMLG
jgi:hypothetical protein